MADIGATTEMTADTKTLSVYDAEIDRYARMVTRSKPDQDLLNFMGQVAPGGHILDLGCGPGNSAAAMADAGFRVSATDGSGEMVALARSRYGVNARKAMFADLAEVDEYDGIWANFSLLHAPKSEFPGHLAQVHRALKPGGILHIGMKTGTGEHRDRIGRFYAFYTIDELKGLLDQAGFTPVSERNGEALGLAGDVEPYVVIIAHA